MDATFRLVDGYDRRKVARSAMFRSMLASEAKALPWNHRELFFITNEGTAKLCRLNGKVKTWKTRPDVEVPVKYGMYECARLSSRPDGTMDRLLVKVSEWSVS